MAHAWATPGSGGRETPTVFEQQREELVREIAVGMEQVLQNINRLNRNLESIIAVGNEFGSVEALWSQFENFMGPRDEEAENSAAQKDGDDPQDCAEVQGREEEEGDASAIQER